MSPQTWRRAAASALAGAALVGGLAAGFTAPSALAQPADPATPAIPPTITADQAIALIDKEYDIGASGGQLSNLIHEVMILRQQGFKASNANRAAIVDALNHRPNQAPLIAALEATLTYQKKLKNQAANQVKQPAVVPPATPGIPQAPMGPSWAPGNPMIQNPNDTIFPMPGRQAW
ncbi:hypothetical protein Mycch_2620 [Mycolicibacterium chubuense NBB4]|uniref:DUF732 domain-containing protein n=1 Tax=Mycolicibacterium chubuense (strain NBB4) TaxID=710421 RepID=I4BJD5_MYCCN|nr:hypothetical protein [Mycolicibacterium chubuense]AFM17392.1 hypothetical protein Mycch_2620 [Mycolicibacterium chubuense NBB4]